MKRKSPGGMALRRYTRIRGEKTYRAPSRDRVAGVHPNEPDYFVGPADNNPGPTPRAPNPDEL